MTDATFERLDPSEQPLYGPRRLILCGFDSAQRKDFEKLIRVAEIEDLDCLWADGQAVEHTLKALFGQGHDPSAKTAAVAGSAAVPDEGRQPRTVIAGGLLQKEFHLLMNLSREVGMPATLWAVLTPVSETWTLSALIKELCAERAAMAARHKSAAQ